jgi:hypothetical protein
LCDIAVVLGRGGVCIGVEVDEVDEVDVTLCMDPSIVSRADYETGLTKAKYIQLLLKDGDDEREGTCSA